LGPVTFGFLTFPTFNPSLSTETAMPHADGGRENAPVENIHTARVRKLNDQFRRTFVGGIVAGTDGFGALGPDLGQRFLRAIQELADFSQDNDPYAEHDFGAVTLEGETVFWKIDYYDFAMVAGSPDPADPDKTLRVLTIMLASEY
jgi:hypothetical protein